MSKLFGILRAMDAYLSASSEPPMTLRCDECGRLTARVYPAVADGVECLICRACRDASVVLLERAWEQAQAKYQRRREVAQ